MADSRCAEPPKCATPPVSCDRPRLLTPVQVVFRPKGQVDTYGSVPVLGLGATARSPHDFHYARLQALLARASPAAWYRQALQLRNPVERMSRPRRSAGYPTPQESAE